MLLLLTCHAHIAQPIQALFMIREKTILCKLNQIKISDIQLLESYTPSAKVCPDCGAVDCCSTHASYSRSMISISHGVRIEKELTIQRVLCSSCKKTHALLSDALIPFASYSLRFILHVLKAYITRTITVEKLCESFQIAISTLYKWIQLFISHTNLLLSAVQ